MTKLLIEVKQLNQNGSKLITNTIGGILIRRNVNLFLNFVDYTKDMTNNEPTLVFIHGVGSSQKVFQEQIKYFSDYYRVIALDLLGHGESSKISEIKGLSPSEKDTISEVFYHPCVMIATIKYLLEKIGVKRAHLIGLSLGGHLAYGLGVDCPLRVSSIIAIGAPPVQFSTSGFREGLGATFVDKTIPSWIKDPKPFTEAEVKDMAEQSGYLDEDLKRSDPLVRKYLFCNMNNDKSLVLEGEKFIKNTQIPVLLIGGDEDIFVPTDGLLASQKQFKHPCSKVEIITAAKHVVFATHRNSFISLLESFFDRLKTYDEDQVSSKNSSKPLVPAASAVTSLATEDSSLERGEVKSFLPSFITWKTAGLALVAALGIGIAVTTSRKNK